VEIVFLHLIEHCNLTMFISYKICSPVTFLIIFVVIAFMMLAVMNGRIMQGIFLTYLETYHLLKLDVTC